MLKSLKRRFRRSLNFSSNSSPPRNPSPPGPYRKKLLTVLTTVSHTSSTLISTFILVHLSAPALANVGGSALSSQTMLFGREYYQTTLSEPLLLLAPLTIHALSGLLRRILSPSPKFTSSPLTGGLSFTGYTLALFLLPIHYLTHRVYPALPEPPIDALGPSELDFEFVKFTLQNFPRRSWCLYGSLVVLTGVHAVLGFGRMYNYWKVGKWRIWRGEGGRTMWGKKDKKKAMAIVLLGVAGPVLSGLWVIAKEPAMVFGGTAARYGAVLRESFVYRK